MEDLKTHINLTGASGTGKTTLLKALVKEFPDLRTNTNVIRDIIKDRNISVNETSTAVSQKIIFDAYMDFLLRNKGLDYISDRCIIDPLAYTMVQVKHGKIDKKLLDSQWTAVKLAVRSFYLNTVFYCPIEFDMEADGIRSENPDFRVETDCAIQSILTALKKEFPYFTVIPLTGSVEERVSTIKKILEKE